MRRMSVHRPYEKVRNPERHLRSLKKWAKGFEGFYPERKSEKYYSSFKIWTLDRLVQGPTSQLEWKQEAIRQLLQAAENLIEAKPESEKGKSWVAILLCYPNLWFSEVAVFYEKKYLDNFIPSELNGKSILNQHGIPVPSKFIEASYVVPEWYEENEKGEKNIFNQQHYTIYEKVL